MPQKVPSWVYAKKGTKKGAGGTNKPTVRKERASRWLVTINFNKKPSQMNEADQRQRYALCAALLDQTRIEPYLYFLNKEDGMKDVISVSVEHEVERSPRNFIHMHAVLVVKHKSSIRLSYPKLKTAFQKIAQIDSKIHMDCKLIRGADDGLAAAKAYIKKDVVKSA
jgi:hypothetical protein